LRELRADGIVRDNLIDIKQKEDVLVSTPGCGREAEQTQQNESVHELDGKSVLDYALASRSLTKHVTL
jgi:hypothetical protein